MADLGINMADDLIRNLMKRLEGIYTEAYKTAIKNEKKAIAKYASLTDEALKDLTPEERQLKREAFAREVKRTKSLANKIAAEIANAGETAAKIIQGELTSIYGLNYDFTTYTIQRQAGIALDFTVYDRNQLAVLVQRKQSPFTKIAYRRLGQNRIIVQRLQNQFIQGILNGESQNQLIKRIQKITGQSVSQARRVVQTERNAVQSQGRNMGIQEANDMGVETERQWIARLRNTRELHVQTHLEIRPIDELFSNGLDFPGDPRGDAANVINCFCFIKPMVKSISPALAKHRTKFNMNKSFDEYREMS